ncbi:hypothetical protein TRFO_36500 [Tritrichomonas foetus]|uniref:Uncharacterized protein n=1 Tax=Tritrichomonas foetus TaxID=1144522 RepID=A0A1J4JIF6_9EUKA|nr:hypothetical protein TRFO_36500 [Tritrichomonas foetus]|eukprot:OHS97309.1 hypothetical protein TRFO_36500 [Tritrichomonas foetus]
MIEESIEENDFKNACDLFGEEFLESHISGDQNVDPLKFIPKTYEEFVRLKKSIIQYYQTVPDEGKFDFSLKLITSLLSPLSSYKISEIYSKEKQKGKL